jgi:flavodoxin
MERLKMTDEISRRMALKSALLLPLVMNLLASPSVAQPMRAGGRTLVAYFSRTGNTRVIAGQIGRSRKADMFEIIPAAAYPEDYEETVSQAERERRSGYRPPLKSKVEDMAVYGTVFLGFPIWGMTAPAVIRSFLSSHDLSGRTLVPFITHGGYGIGQSLAVVTEHAAGARLVEAFVKQADQERQTLTEVSRWLAAAPAGE